MADGGVPGVEDVAALGRWLSGHGIAGDDPPRVSIIGGGRSNLTYRLDLGPDHGAGQPPLILRRPPLGHVLPTAHDMSREFRVLGALAGTEVPVPRPIALCQDPEVIGAPFYLMEYVPGAVLRTAQDAAVLSPAQAGQLSRMFVRMLASIHGLDIEAAGLTGFGRPEGYLARQLSRWQRQWELSSTRDMPGYDELVGRLAAGLPGTGGAPEGAGGLVHGDYRLDNMLVVAEAEPQIAAVVDWEMSTLGDPLADLGLSLVYWTDPGEQDWLPAASVTTAPGFLSRAQLAAEYAAVTGRDLSRIGYYMAFGCFKLAVVLEGIHARFLQRKTVGEGFEREGQAVPVLIARAHELLDGTAH
jgi:aminoglycoside phosphotransferase (APT) family kinase protein